MFVDTHCHIHETNYPGAYDALRRAQEHYVTKIICVGTDGTTSRQAVEFAKQHEGAWSSIGVHPHDAKEGYGIIARLASMNEEKVVAIGEIGLDYF